MRTRKTVLFFQIVLAAIFQHQGIVAQALTDTKNPSEKIQLNAPIPMDRNESEVLDIRKSTKAKQNSYSYLNTIKYFDDEIAIIDNKIHQVDEMEEKIKLQNEKTELVTEKNNLTRTVRKQKQIPNSKQD